MRKIFLALYLLSFFLLILSCEKIEKDPELNDFCNIAPEGWRCELIVSDFNQQDIPRNISNPIAIVKFYGNDSLVSNYLGKIVPSLILDIYPIEQKKELEALVQSQQMYSWCIPIYYGETKSYYILTSPCFKNSGDSSEESKASIHELENALKRIMKQ